MTVKHPTILWAQRSPHVYLSIEVEDMKIDEMSVDGDNFKIRGSKGDETYQADLKLYGKLKGEERRQVATDRRVELIIPKESAEWWPRLLQEKSKVPWIKVDFNKWVDEDEENDVSADGMDDMGMGGLGMPGMGGMDFSSFGMPGAGSNGFPMNNMNFEDDADDDDDVGELEDIENSEDGDENSKTETSDGSPKKSVIPAESAEEKVGAKT